MTNPTVMSSLQFAFTMLSASCLLRYWDGEKSNKTLASCNRFDCSVMQHTRWDAQARGLMMGYRGIASFADSHQPSHEEHTHTSFRHKNTFVEQPHRKSAVCLWATLGWGNPQPLQVAHTKNNPGSWFKPDLSYRRDVLFGKIWQAQLPQVARKNNNPSSWPKPNLSYRRDVLSGQIWNEEALSYLGRWHARTDKHYPKRYHHGGDEDGKQGFELPDANLKGQNKRQSS